MKDNLFARVRGHVLDALRQTIPVLPDAVAEKVEVTPPREPGQGDMATNAALVAAKVARQPPAKLAEAIAERLRAAPVILHAEAAGPGFVNMKVQPRVLRALLPVILLEGVDYGNSTMGGG